jgi:hypothetical protein
MNRLHEGHLAQRNHPNQIVSATKATPTTISIESKSNRNPWSENNKKKIIIIVVKKSRTTRSKSTETSSAPSQPAVTTFSFTEVP